MMAKSTKASNRQPSKTQRKRVAPSQVTITYDLFDLPTAQHKAGLAGLLLQIESMKNRKLPAPRYRWHDGYPRTAVHVDFTEETTTALFDDLYDAALIEGPVREKPFTKGKGNSERILPPVRRASMTKTDKKGNETIIEGYIYHELTPALRTLRHYLPSAGDWVRLWRDLIWQVIRDGRKKAPYIRRAAKKKQLPKDAVVKVNESDDSSTSGSDNSEGDGSSWTDMRKIAAAQAAGTFAIGTLSGALLLGAMAENAENVPLYSRLDHSLLLHFWPLAMLVFVPRFLDGDGESYIGRRNSRDNSPHFAITIPDVADLRTFLRDYPRLLASLGTEMAVFRPRESIVDIPAEGGFSFIEHLARLMPQQVAATELLFSISAVEYYHVTKEGNNVKCLSTGRIGVDPRVPERYRRIADDARNPLFRRALMLALLEDVPWFQPFGQLFAEWPHKFFVPCDDSPKLSWFWADARKKLKEVSDNMHDDPQSPPDPNDQLAALVYRLVRTYLAVKAADKSGVDPDTFKTADGIQWDKVPQAYKDERRQVAETLFMEYRSRHDQAFVSHFVARLGAVKQYIREADYIAISQALMTRAEDVKILTLLALSANQ